MAGKVLLRFLALKEWLPGVKGGNWHWDSALRTVNDLVLVNGLAALMVESFEHCVDLNTNLQPLRIGDKRPYHAPLRVVVSATALMDAKITVLPLERPGPSVESRPHMNQEDAADLAQEVWDQHASAFQCAIHAGSPDDAYRVWSSAATEFLSRRVGLQWPPRGALAKPQVVPAAGFTDIGSGRGAALPGV